MSNIKNWYSFFYEEIIKNDLDEKIDKKLKRFKSKHVWIETISNYTLNAK